LKQKLSIQHVADNIEDYNLDLDFPYDSKHD